MYDLYQPISNLFPSHHYRTVIQLLADAWLSKFGKEGSMQPNSRLTVSGNTILNQLTAHTPAAVVNDCSIAARLRRTRSTGWRPARSSPVRPISRAPPICRASRSSQQNTRCKCASSRLLSMPRVSVGFRRLNLAIAQIPQDFRLVHEAFDVGCIFQRRIRLKRNFGRHAQA